MAGGPVGARRSGSWMTVDQICDAIGAAHSIKRHLRIAGAATWLDSGRPVHAENTLSIAALSGVVDYVPGDLTITVRGGTPLSEIQRITAEQGQWLSLNPFGNPGGTIGATVATASWGTLGVITEVTLRLYSIPKVSVTLAVAMPSDARQLRDRLRALYTLPINAHAIELIDAQLASQIGFSAEPMVLMNIGGTEPSVTAQRRIVWALGGVNEIPAEVWDA